MAIIIMPFHRRNFGNSKRPIVSNKNEQVSTNIGVAAAVATTVVLATQVNDYIGTPNTCPIGASISSMFIHVDIQPQATAGVIDWYLAKAKTGEVAALPVPGAVAGDINRNKVFHEEHGLPGVFNNGASPNTTKMVFVVPKRYRRMSETDQWILRARCSTAYDFCVQAIYKFYQ